ncbi:hypothetical protein ACLOJK_038738 [Asimina triloba]
MPVFVVVIISGEVALHGKEDERMREDPTLATLSASSSVYHRSTAIRCSIFPKEIIIHGRQHGSPKSDRPAASNEPKSPSSFSSFAPAPIDDPSEPTWPTAIKPNYQITVGSSRPGPDLKSVAEIDPHRAGSCPLFFQPNTIQSRSPMASRSAPSSTAWVPNPFRIHLARQHRWTKRPAAGGISMASLEIGPSVQQNPSKAAAVGRSTNPGITIDPNLGSSGQKHVGPSAAGGQFFFPKPQQPWHQSKLQNPSG